jgi:hypothetical protein
MNKLSIIDKIRKLFALGDKTRNPNEGEVKTALSMATKLMKEHNLSLSEIDLEKQKEDIEQSHTEERKNISFWERKLAKMVGELFDCEYFMHNGEMYSTPYNYRYKQFITFIGLKEEVKLASECYDYLNYTLRILANIHAKNKLDFYAGITDRLQERINEEIKSRTPEENSKCTAIVCCKDALIKKYKEKNLKLHTIHRRKPNIDEVSPDYYKGYLAGNNLDLQNKRKIK